MTIGRDARQTLRMLFGMGFGELVLILVIVVVVFGATKLPQLGSGLGDGFERFRDRLQRSAPPPPARLRLVSGRRSPRCWAPADWLLVGAAVAAGVLALLAFIASSR